MMKAWFERFAGELRQAGVRLQRLPWLLEAAALLGGVVFVLRLFTYAHSQESVLDEGAYVYKGWLFATGQYTPYAPYGPWTNHLPLAFLLPGWFQTLFEPGLRTARYVSIAWAALFLVAVWIVARRLGGRGWALAAVCLIAANTFLAKSYATAVSQGMIACMLAWALAFVLGEKRPLWQIALGGFLAGVMVLTRINMLPVLPLLVLYVWWQHGWKPALVSAAAGGAIFLFFHVLYWPDILQMWTRLPLPRWMTPFLDPYRLPKAYVSSWKPDVFTLDRLLSWFDGMRFQFIAIMGVLAALLLWPARTAWKKAADLRSAVFLIVLFVSLLLAHLWAALGKDYCVSCLAGYESFFSITGVFLLILILPIASPRMAWWKQLLVIPLLLVVGVGMGYAAFEQFGNSLYDMLVPRWLALDFSPGLVPLGAIITNKWGVEAVLLRRLLPTLFGGLAALLALLAALLAWMIWRWAHRASAPSYGALALTLWLALGALFTPHAVLSGGYNTYDCSGDSIAMQEAAGAALAERVPPGSLAYWKGPLSTIPLLYAPGVRIFPAQINDGYSHLQPGGDPDEVQRFGRWNEVLARQWAAQADYILIEGRSFRGWLRELVEGPGYQRLPATPPTSCRDDSNILIFKKLP